MPLTAYLQPLLVQAAAQHCRLPVLLQGDSKALLKQALALVTQLQPQKLYWLGEDAPAAGITLQPGSNYQLLGSECDMLIINACSGFNADLVAASAGCLKAGGLWLIIAPEDRQWCQQPNPAHGSLLSYPLQPDTHCGSFIRFWLARLACQPLVKLILHDGALTVQQQLALPDDKDTEQAAPPYATIEQQHAIQAILKVVSGHRKRPLVLVADRGRGKSAALGLAAALLLQQGKQHIVITAASPGAAATAINHCTQQLETKAGLRFMPVDQLLQELPKLDLLLVDEAAALPTAILKQLADHYSRIVFATTEHGYEGTGRGFQLRFQHYLDLTQPGWSRLQLSQPIRYQQQDPLEQLIFDSFLLRQPAAQHAYQPEKPLEMRQYRYNDWLTAPDALLAVFHLLSQAHYQTQVKDLAALLDNPQLSVVALYQQDQLLACALLSYEGKLEPELCQQIYQGQRRVRGHLLAQSLAFHLAQPQLANQQLVRIMRIAVAVPVQRHGLGSKLLSQLAELVKSEANWLGTSFGVNPQLLAFWLAAGYTPVRLSHFADNASSEPSILMLQPLNTSKQLVEQLNQQLGDELYHCLAEYPQNLSFSIISKLIRPPMSMLTEDEINQLQLFAAGKRPYQLIAGLLLKWFNLNFLQLQQEAADIMSARLWQKQSWQQISVRFGQAGKTACIKLMQQQVTDHT